MSRKNLKWKSSWDKKILKIYNKYKRETGSVNWQFALGKGELNSLPDYLRTAAIASRRATYLNMKDDPEYKRKNKENTKKYKEGKKEVMGKTERGYTYEEIKQTDIWSNLEVPLCNGGNCKSASTCPSSIKRGTQKCKDRILKIK